jgi:prevent-host-death family protein
VRYSTRIKPISYLKANAAEVLQELADQRQPMVITQNGEAKAVIQDVVSYEETQETLALLKILALGNQQVAQGRIKPLAQHVLSRILDIADTLTAVPTRGTPPKELRALGNQEYRQVFFKPFRLIYRVIGQQVVIYLITNGLRDMQSLLARRLLGG